ncbi:universal stress protein [Streptomyces sp. NPDC048392]|uniref:universal stress protein n=1 Tax=Streptomyces sp. NPDC048392 TaxID=3365543 RepID=UPI003710B087
MTRTITVGIDGSPQSHAAAEWAAREAELRDLPVRLLHVWEPAPAVLAQDPVLGAKTHQHWTERVPQKVGDGLRLKTHRPTSPCAGTPSRARHARCCPPLRRKPACW